MFYLDKYLNSSALRSSQTIHSSADDTDWLADGAAFWICPEFADKPQYGRLTDIELIKILR